MLQRGVDAGELPVLAQLVEEGAWVALDDFQELLTPTSWPTLVRGSNVSEHLLLCDRQLVPGTYRIAPVPANAARRPPFWRYVSDAGLRSTVASVYGAPLLDHFRGTQVVGWGTHDPFTSKLAGPRSDPPGLIQQLERKVGSRSLRYGARLPRTHGDYQRYIDECRRGVRQQARALARLTEETEWDLFFGSFSDAHQAGHLMWHLANADHPDHDPDADENLRDGLMAIYRETDAAIGEVVERLPEATALFLASPYGMGANRHLDESIDGILTAGGWLVRGRPHGAGVGAHRLRTLELGRAIVRRTVPAGLRPWIGRRVGRDRLVDELALAGIDWTRTAAFSMPADGCTFVRVNLAGREPAGTVSRGRSYDALCTELQMALHELRHAETGAPIVERVARFDELFGVFPEGPLPDLCIQWRRGGGVDAVRSDRLGTLAVPAESPLKSVQTAPGFLLGRAPGIRPSESRRLEGTSARLVDVAATVLAWLDVPPPHSVSGRPPAALSPAATQPRGAPRSELPGASP